jgi:pimeloyl-ACP methyl ester carboxylesterase
MKLRAVVGVVVLAASLLTACSSDNSSTDVTVASGSPNGVEWLPCGDIECARIDVPRVGSDLEGDTIKVSVYRRVSAVKKAPVLVLLPDRTFGDNARTLVEDAPLKLGAVAREYTLISISPRGTADSPLELTDVNLMSSLDDMDDVFAVKKAMGFKKFAVMGWGAGATTAAALVMTQPSQVLAAVLDSPQDPGESMVRQAEQQLASMQTAVVTAMRWCASHLSCPTNANVAQAFSQFKTNLRLGRLGAGIDFDTIARAATNSIAQGDPQSLFIAINEASEGDGAKLLAMAGPLPTPESSRAACANVSASAAQRIASIFADFAAKKIRHFYMGTEAFTYGFCDNLPATQRPLGEVKAIDGTTDVKAFVTIARGDPVVPPYTPRTMAKRMGWTYKSVYANRHLVIGIDQAITAQAFEFLDASLND